MESDLRRYYGVDLADLWRSDSNLTWRQLGVLITGLPPESALSTALRLTEEFESTEQDQADYDPEPERWSRQEQLLAALVDELRALRHVTVSVNSEHPPKWDVEPIPRPGQGRQKKTRISPESADFLFNLINGE